MSVLSESEDMDDPEELGEEYSMLVIHPTDILYGRKHLI
jgi:hypothetical protein